MKTTAANGQAGLIRGPMGGLIGAGIGCSAWQIRVLIAAQGAGMVPWLILAMLFLISVAFSPAIAYYGLTVRRWSGLKTLIAFLACMVSTNALFVAASYMLVGGRLFQGSVDARVLLVVAAVLAALLLFPPMRTRIARNFEIWRDAEH